MKLGLLRELQLGIEERQLTMKELGSTANNRDFLLSAAASTAYYAGRWSNALAIVDEFEARLAEGATHYLETDFLSTRALIRLARDQLHEALADAERAAAVAALSGDPQVLVPSRCLRAFLRLSKGSIDAANADFEELLAGGETSVHASDTETTMLAWVALDLGRVDDGQRILAGVRSRRWSEVAQAILVGDAAKAADLLQAIGDFPAEAYARLRAGADHLHQALAFYRSVDATRYIREAESQLAASA